jgi:uncharacterized protein YpmS
MAGENGGVRLKPAFKYAFFTLLGLTILFLLLALAMTVFIAHPTESQTTAETWLFGAASSAFSALIGMLAGKVV